MKEQRVREILESHEALWLYPEKPRKEIPHALLTSGQHSDGFANVGAVLKNDQKILHEIAGGLLLALRYHWSGRFSHVVGADTSSTDLAGELARITGAKHLRMVKIDDKKGKRQVWHEENQLLREGQVILHIEELVTTSSSALQVRRGIRLVNPDVTVTFAPFVAVIVDRSDPDRPRIDIEGSPVLSMLRLKVRNYDPDSCPYCAVGSVALRPKEGDNWSKLTER